MPALAGLGLGLAGSVALSRTMAMFLYETSALDPAIYAAVTGVLLLVTTVACLVPAGARPDSIRWQPSGANSLFCSVRLQPDGVFRL